MPGARRYRDDGDGLGDGGVWGSSGTGDGLCVRGYIIGSPRIGDFHYLLYLISYLLICFYNEVHTLSFPLFRLTRSFRDSMWIYAMEWIITAG